MSLDYSYLFMAHTDREHMARFSYDLERYYFMDTSRSCRGEKDCTHQDSLHIPPSSRMKKPLLENLDCLSRCSSKCVLRNCVYSTERGPTKAQD